MVLGVPDAPVAAALRRRASSTLPAKLSATVSSRPTAARSRIERGAEAVAIVGNDKEEPRSAGKG